MSEKRKARASERICSALIDLCSTKNIDALTVTALCRRAGVSRDTFYYHFKDKYDVAGRILADHYAVTLDCLGTTKSSYDSSLSLYQTLLRHKQFYRNAWFSEDFNSLHRYAIRYGTVNMQRSLLMLSPKLRTPTIEQLLRYNVYANTCVMEQWIADGMEVPPEVMATWAVQSFPAPVIEAFNASLKRHQGIDSPVAGFPRMLYTDARI